MSYHLTLVIFNIYLQLVSLVLSKIKFTVISIALTNIQKTEISILKKRLTDPPSIVNFPTNLQTTTPVKEKSPLDDASDNLPEWHLGHIL